MTSDSATPFVDLTDDFAINAMVQLIQIYSPEDTGDKEEMVLWCEAIASTAYLMAGAMMNARSILHKAMIEDSQDKEQNAA